MRLRSESCNDPPESIPIRLLISPRITLAGSLQLLIFAASDLHGLDMVCQIVRPLLSLDFASYHRPNQSEIFVDCPFSFAQAACIWE